MFPSGSIRDPEPGDYRNLTHCTNCSCNAFINTETAEAGTVASTRGDANSNQGRVTQYDLLRAKAFRTAIFSNGDSAAASHTIAQANWRCLAYHAGLGEAAGKLVGLARGQEVCVCSHPRCGEQNRLG